jgi:hypothetical protein
VLGNHFSPDDLVLLEWARGIVPPPDTLWRHLSGRLYFGVAIGLFGTNPLPYLLVNWALHGVNVALAYAFVRRLGGGALAAILVAGLFGCSRLFLTVVGQAVGFGDLVALGFVLLAGIALTLPTRRATALGAFATALALLSKETVVAIPLALLLAPAVGPSLPMRLRRLAPGFVMGVLWFSEAVRACAPGRRGGLGQRVLERRGRRRSCRRAPRGSAAPDSTLLLRAAGLGREAQGDDAGNGRNVMADASAVPSGAEVTSRVLCQARRGPSAPTVSDTAAEGL